MKIVNIFNEDGKSLDQLIEKLIIDYCFELKIFK